MAAWKLPLLVAAIVFPVVAGFMLGGPGIGVAVGALAAVAILVVAAGQRPHGPIVPPSSDDLRRHVLIVATCSLEDPAAVREVARAARLGDAADDAEVLVLAPARIGFLDRWASDLEPARQAAQRALVATVAALAKAGIAAEARVGDADVVQAVEDELQSFPATDVLLVSQDGEDGEDAAAAELEPRLGVAFAHLVVSPPGR
jgi:hypothetical protein